MTDDMDLALCNSTFNSITELGVVSMVTSSLLSVVTMPTAGIIIYTIIKNSKDKCKGLFYKLLLNIAIADLCTGVFVDIAAINFHVKETLEMHISKIEVYSVHVSLFVTDTVALVAVAVLSADRVFALTKPFRYRQGLPAWVERLLLILPWPIAVLIVIPYFYVDYIKQLAIFASVAVLVAVVSLCTTVFIYKFKQGVLCYCSGSQKCLDRRGSAVRALTSMSFSPIPTSNFKSFSMDAVAEKEKPIHKDRKISSSGPIKFLPNSSEVIVNKNIEVGCERKASLKASRKGRRPTLGEIGKTSRIDDSSTETSSPDFITKDTRRQTLSKLGKFPEVELDVKETKPLALGAIGKTATFDYLPRVIELQNAKRHRSLSLTISRRLSNGTKRESIVSRLSGCRSAAQKRVTRTFILMIILFIVSYLPTCAMVLYMNFCQRCNCGAVHIMRDMSFMLIACSSPLRALNFIFTQRHVKNTASDLLLRCCCCCCRRCCCRRRHDVS